MKINHPGHLVGIVGGAVAGSEAAARFSERGVYSVVFDMGRIPWGKIEYGLPKWHAKQRDQEERLIDERLCSPYVTFVPGTKLGTEITLQEAVSLGFSAVLLAVGAWRDRPFPVEGIDEYQGRGFCYQNPFVAWFNGHHSPGYRGPIFEAVDGSIVVGGGLASLDVVKILMLETTRRALAKRGCETDLFVLEKKGIPKVLEGFDLRWEDLGLRGCTLYYRRRAQDMPLIPLDDDPTAEQIQQAERVRVKLLETQRAKYLFEFVPCAAPVGKLVEGNRLEGIVFRRTRVGDGRVVPVPGTDFEVRAPLTISSIGSVPDLIPGLPMRGELIDLEDPSTGRIRGFENVFALGNAVTGRGNIRASRIHGRQVAEWVMDEYLGWRSEDYQKLQVFVKPADPNAKESMDRFVAAKALMSIERLGELAARVAGFQEKVGYDGDYSGWVSKHRPIRLEDLA